MKRWRITHQHDKRIKAIGEGQYCHPAFLAAYAELARLCTEHGRGSPSYHEFKFREVSERRRRGKSRAVEARA